MGRIEDAIQRLQASAAGQKRQSTGAGDKERHARIANIEESGIRRIHDYHGKAVIFDRVALRQHGLLAPDVESRSLEEQYRAIKRPVVDNANPQKDPGIEMGNVVVVASALASEGKSFSCVNFCLSVAREKDWTVLLVDGDCAKPHLTRLLSAENELGLLDLLVDKSLDPEAVIMPTDVDGLSFLPTGTRNQNAAELLASQRMKTLCSAMAQADPMRMIVFDSSPLLLTSESPILASHAGQILLVVKANSTPQQAVLSALDKLDRSKPIGLLLNQQLLRVESAGSDYYSFDYGLQDAS